MNTLIKLVFLVLCTTVIFSVPMSIGVALHSDGVLTTMSIEPRQRLKISIETGPGWENNADLRINDLILRNSYTYKIFSRSIFSLNTQASLEYRQIDTETTVFNAPGISAGCGIELDLRKWNGYLYAGPQYVYSRKIKKYTGTAATVFYSDEWTAPYVWVSIGCSVKLN